MKSPKRVLPVVISTLLLSPIALAQDYNHNADGDRGFEGAAHDAWITGKIETVYTFNSELNPFKIDTDVENGIVRLTGEVESEIDKNLAAELARGVEGVEFVQNDLMVNPEYDYDYDNGGENADAADRDRNLNPRGRSDLAQWFSDTTTTAVVKSKLLANDNTQGLQIDVDTTNNVVTLTGAVDSDAEKQLAEEIARNSRNVDEVLNNLTVDPSA